MKTDFMIGNGFRITVKVEKVKVFKEETIQWGIKKTSSTNANNNYLYE